jgi:hypothetical protein
MTMQLSIDAERCLYNLYDFLVEYWGLDREDEESHRAMCQPIQDAELGDGPPFVMLVVPRGSWKSSIARGACVWKQLRQIHLFDNPYHRICFLSSTLALGRLALRTIEEQLRYNRKLAEAYGELWATPQRKGEMGSKVEDGIMLAPRLKEGSRAAIADPSFWVGSVRAAQTGRHADEAYVDDLNDKENTATVFQREKAHRLWSLIFPLIGSQTGHRPKITFTCTPWHDDDVSGRIQRRERERTTADENYQTPWTLLKHGVVNEDGTAFLPTKYPLSCLEQLKEDVGDINEYSSNYLCDPVGERGFVNQDEIIFRKRETFPPLRDLRISVDPNQHKEASALGCYAAMVVVGFDRFAHMYVLDARGAREWDTGAFIDALFDVQDSYPHAPIFIEDSHMGHFDHALNLEQGLRERRLRVNWVPLDVQVSKYDRWKRIQPRFKAHQIVFAEEIAPKIKLEIQEELVRGQAARFNDFLDALAGAETGVRPRAGKDGQLVEFDPMRGRPGEKARKLTFADALPVKFRGNIR